MIKLDRITKKQLDDIFDAYEIIKIDNERSIRIRPIFYYEGIKNTENDLIHFTKLCELTSMYDKVGDTYYNAKKVLCAFPYDEIEGDNNGTERNVC